MSAHDPNSTPASDDSEDMGLLGQVLGATRREERSETPDIVKSLIGDALKGTISRSKNTSETAQNVIRWIERKVSDQLAKILHDPTFQALEASWRGLFELVRRSETDSSLKIRVLNVSKSELAEDLASESAIESSRLSRKLNAYREQEGEEPYAVLVDDHDFASCPDDITLLGKLANVAASAGCLVLASGSPTHCGLASWSELDDDAVLGEGGDPESARAWNQLRASEAAQSVVLAMPRILARPPYGADTSVVEEFPFEELGRDAGSVDPGRLTWMSAVYLVATVVNDAFTQEGREGVNELFESGARIGRQLYFYTKDEDGDTVVNGPAEIVLDRRRDAELRELGYTGLQSSRDGDSLVINGFRTLFREPESD